jgi:hypothetical protein
MGRRLSVVQGVTRKCPSQSELPMGRDFDGEDDVRNTNACYPKRGIACHPRSSNEKSRVRAVAVEPSQRKG